MVQSADQTFVADGERMERAICHDHGAIAAAGLVRVLGEDVDGEVESSIRRRRAVTGAGGNGCSASGGRVAQRVEDWCARAR
jgi:hypothetical protein